ncbi:MAG TPA: diacylglycerol kinase family protein [Rhizomicrobium sp.]
MMSDLATDNQDANKGACVCLLNGAARSNAAEGHRDQLTKIFAAQGSDTRIITPTRGDIEAAIRRALDSGCRRIIAAGGDGTVHAVANALVGTTAALAVLPLGTLNHFALDLGIPLELEAAVHVALTGNVRNVDVGEVNGRVFVNNSSIGLYPRIVREREALQRQGESKLRALARATVGVFRRSKALRLHMRYSGKSLQTLSDFVFIGNNEYQFSAGRVTGRPRLDGGALSVWQVPHAGRLRAVAAAVAALLGMQPKSPLAFSTDELVLEPRAKRLLVAMDGEAMEMEAPLTYCVRPGALRVIVPSETSG